MPTNRFYVVMDHGHWSIKYFDRNIGPFPSRQEAVDAAIEAAQASGCMGHETEVLVEGEGATFQIVWSYGQES